MNRAAIIARESELAAVDEFLAESATGFAALAIEGQAGIGKSTVWREACARAEALGALVLRCSPSESEAKLSFAGVSDLLSPLDEAEIESLPGPQRDALMVALLRRAPSAEPLSARATAAGLLTLLRRLCVRRRLVIAVDDVQWLDPPSRAALQFAARRIEQQPIGILVSVRRPATAPGGLDLPSGERMRQLTLGPLSLAAIGQIIATSTGGTLARPVLVRIMQASGGNPFFALEIARLLVESEAAQLPGGPLPVPAELQAVTAERIKRLPEATREALLVAAVMSRPDERRVDPALLAPAEEQGILAVDALGRIQFAHPLFAAAIYDAATTASRRSAHRRAAEMTRDIEPRARHLALASSEPDPAVAAQLDQASAHAAARGAPATAAELSELAVQRTPSADIEVRAERRLAAAAWQYDAGGLVRASELAAQAAHASSPDHVRARALQLAAQLAGRQSNFIEAAHLAAQALAVAGSDPGLRGSIEMEAAYCATGVADLAAAQRHAANAAEMAELASDVGLRAEALAVAAMAHFMGGRGLDTARIEQALALEDPQPGARFMLRPTFIHGLLDLWTGELSAARRTLQRLLDDVLERGQEGAAPLLFMYLVWADLWSGDMVGADRVAQAAREAASLLEDRTSEMIALTTSALVHAHDGHGEQARVEGARALRLCEELEWRMGTIWPLWALGLTELVAGNPAGVDAVLGPLSEQVLAMGGGDPVILMFLPDEIEALVALGEMQRAAAYLEPFAETAAALQRPWAMAAVHRLRGILAAAAGDYERAVQCFDASLSTRLPADMPVERGRTLLLAGQVHRRNRQRGRARDALTEALGLFERHKVPPWAQRCHDELARLGGRPAQTDALTATERRVAELAAAGLSNHEVANRAFLTVKTVEANLTRVYRKLGVRSRAGLARAIQDQDRSPPVPPERQT